MVDGVRVRIINPEAIPLAEKRMMDFVLKYEPLRRQRILESEFKKSIT